MLSIAFSNPSIMWITCRRTYKRGHRNKVKEGIWPQMSPIGYVNVQRWWNYSAYRFSTTFQKDIWRHIQLGTSLCGKSATKFNGLGLKRKAVESLPYRKLSKTSSKIPIYTGLMLYNGRYCEASTNRLFQRNF